MAAQSVVAVPGAPLEPERRLTELARSAGPLRGVVVALAGRLVAGASWSRLGYARLADYARERLGLSARSLQEFARVDRVLAELPRLEAALVSGALPWSKVRLLARFVSTKDEGVWIARARCLSVRGLERSCRAVDRGALEAGAPETDEEGHDTEPSEWVRVRAPLGLAFKWRHTQRNSAKVAGEPTPPAVVLEMVMAEALSALPVPAVADGLAGDSSEGESWSEATGAVSIWPSPSPPRPAEDVCPTKVSSVPPQASRVELPRFLEPLVHGIEHADAFELDARLRRAIRLEQRLDAQISPLLRHVTQAGFEWRGLTHTLASFAREHLGMSARKARALVRLERAGDVCPELRSAYRDGTLSWVQAQILAPLLLIEAEAEGDWRRAWVAWASRVTVRRFGELVDHALWLREADPRAWERGCEDPEGLDASLSDRELGGADNERQTCARPTDSVGPVRIRVWAPRDVARLFRAVLCSVRLTIERETGRLASDAEAFETMIDHANATWGVDEGWLKRQLRARYAVFARDGWRCAVPGCSSRRNLHAHHVVFRSAGGSDALDNQTTLCAFHHQRGVHGGTVRITGSAPDALGFELGTREGMPPLARYRSGDRVARVRFTP